MAILLLLLMTEVFMFFFAYFLDGNDIMAPPVMMSAMFVFSTSFTIANATAWGVDYSLNSVLVLTTGILVFIISNSIYKIWYNKFKIIIPRSNRYNVSMQELKAFTLHKWILLMFLCFSIICLSWYAAEIRRITGQSGNVFGRIAGLYRAMTVHITVSDDSFEGVNIILSQLLKIVDVLGYVCGYLFLYNQQCKNKDQKTQLYLMAILAVSYLPQFMIAGRGAILQKTSALLIYWYIVWNQKYEWKRNLSFKFIRIGIVVIILSIPAFYYSLNLIGRKTDITIMQHAAKYVGSSIFEFDLYMKSPSTPPRVFGEESLIGVHSLLYRIGVDTYVRDVNLEKRAIASNVYTFFRRPLHDFGLMGMYIFTFLIGYFFSWLYNGKIKYRQNNHIWAIIMGYFYYWIVVSSIMQYSFTYISINTVIKLILIVVLFRFLNIKFKFCIREI